MLNNDLLQISANLYKFLSNTPTGEERTAYISKINKMLDDRGGIIEKLKQNGFTFDPSNKEHQMLLELDKGIRERLKVVMLAVKNDIKDLNHTKKVEMQYMNPYSNLQSFNAKYYDGKR